jgi:predicted RNA polymerase sigma factor
LTDQLRADLPPSAEESVAVPKSAVVGDARGRRGVSSDQDDSRPAFPVLHPALSPASQVALTLRAVGGLTTAQIASAFFVPEATMAQRISRAKQSIRAAPADLPPAEGGRATRSSSTCSDLQRGYGSAGGPPAGGRPQAIRLTRDLHRLLPDDGEVSGLLALMLLTDARRDARTRPDGSLVPLAEQDRARWNRALIAEGVDLITETLSRAPIGPYQLQAAIAAVHDEAERADETDWPQILVLYDPGKRRPTVVTLNQRRSRWCAPGPG